MTEDISTPVTQERASGVPVSARSMRTGTTGAIGLIVSDISNPLFASMARAADATLSPMGYALMLANSANDVEHEAELISAFRQRRLDGLMIATADEGADGLGGRIVVESAPGAGTRVRVLLPRGDNEVAPAPPMKEVA